MSHSTLTLAVAFVWIGFLVCSGLLLWKRIVDTSARQRIPYTPRPGDNPDAIVARMHEMDMEARGSAVRDRVQAQGAQFGLGLICVLLFLVTIYFSRGR